MNIKVSRSGKEGFTLIELLVVVSIIALLVSILLPALGKARTTAQRVYCGTNLKQIAMAGFLFAEDNDDMLVQKRDDATGIVDTDSSWDWCYAQSWGVDTTNAQMDWLICPSDKKPRGSTQQFLDMDHFSNFYTQYLIDNPGTEVAKRSYSLNRVLYNGFYWKTPEIIPTNTPISGNASGLPQKVTRVTAPAEKIFAFDNQVSGTEMWHIYYYGKFGHAGLGNVQHAELFSSFFLPQAAGLITLNDHEIPNDEGTMHEDGGNFAFLDGHVGWHRTVKGAVIGTDTEIFDGLSYPNSWLPEGTYKQ